MKSPEINCFLFDSEKTMGWTDINPEIALQDMFEPVDFHHVEEVRNLFKFHIGQLLFSSLAGNIYRFVYLL